MTALAVVTIVIGALLFSGGVQELVAQGILNSRLYPLIGGTLGAVAGAFVLSAGVALLRRSPSALSLARVAVAVSLPTFLLIGIIRPLAGRGVTIVGIVMPLVLLAVMHRRGRDGSSVSRPA